MQPLYTRKTAILAGIEAAYGVDPGLDEAVNAILVQNLKFKPNPEIIDRKNVALPDLSNLTHLIGKLSGELSFDVELRGSGNANGDVPPDYGVFLRMCSMAQTIQAGPGGSVSYDFISQNQESGAIYCYLDGQMQKFLGCMGDWKLVGKNSNPGLWSFTLKGKWGGAADVALVNPNYQNLHPPLCKGVTFAYGGWSAPLSQWEIDAKNTVTEREDQTDDNGVAGFLISSRAPEAKFNPEMQLLAQRDVWNNLISAHEAALSIALGADPGNQVAIVAPKCAKKAVDQGDRSGIAIYDTTVGLYRTSGNDELTITFT